MSKLPATAFDDFFKATQPAQALKTELVAPVVAKKKAISKPINLANPKKAKPIQGINEKKQSSNITDQDEPEANSTAENIERIRFATLIRPDLHRRLKMRCVESGIDIYEAIEEALENYLKNE